MPSSLLALHRSSLHSPRLPPPNPPPPDFDIPALRHAIVSLDSKVLSLLRQRDSLANRLASAVAAQSPIRRLPDELLTKCFEIGVRDNEAPYTPFPSEPEDPLFLTRIQLVCRHWNALALADCKLWSTITVSNTESVAKAYRKIKRSKAVPLDVTISFIPRLNGSSAGEPIMRAMEMLRATIYRWKTFRMRVPNRVHAHAALKLCTKDRAPVLEAISIQISNAMQEDQYSVPPGELFRGFAPRLRSCHFTAFHYDWEHALLQGLRVLRLGGYWNGHAPSGMQLRVILQNCPQIEELSFRNMTDIDPDCDDLTNPNARPLPPLHLPYLRSVTFYYSGGERALALLSNATFPSLQKLELAFLDNITPIFEVLKRQASSKTTKTNIPVGLPLRTLRIESCYFNEFKFVRALKRIPRIEKLELIDVEDVSANLIKGLSTPPQAQQWILPQLEHLSLEGCAISSIDWESMSTLVESRIPSQTMHRPPLSKASNGNAFIAGDLGPPRRLRTLDLTRCTQFSREQILWLRMYVNEVKWEIAKVGSVWGAG